MKGFFVIVLIALPGILLRAQNQSLKWAKQMGGSSSNGSGNSIALDKAGNVYTTGSFTGTIDFDPGPGVYNMTSVGQENIFVFKLDSAGNFLWAKQMGKIGDAGGAAIVLDSSGYIYATGYFNGTTDFDPGISTYELTSFGGDGDIFVLKLDGDGNFMWAKQMGGIYSDQGFSIALDKFGNIYFTGEAEGEVDFDPGPAVFSITSWGHFVSKLDASGNFVWAKIMFATGFSTGRSIAIDANENVYTTGWFGGTVDFDPGLGEFNMSTTGVSNFVLKLNSSGNFSVVILELTIKSQSLAMINKTICHGETYEGHTKSGTYPDTLLAQNGCDSIITLNLTVLTSPSPDLGADKNLCPGDSLVLLAGTYDSYQWQDGSIQSTLTVKQPGLYSVIVTDNCGTGRDEIFVKETTCNILFPSAFTPNNDGKNDLFKILGKDELTEYTLAVYDRWGQKVFSTNDYKKGWDGNFRGKLQETGVYAWYCSYKKANGHVTKKGTILLIR